MFDRLLANWQSCGVIAIVFLLANAVQANSQEYVFSAPPEVDYESIEIPNSDTEYPLYECDREHGQVENAKVDSHDCDCVDCENVSQDSEKSEQLTFQNQHSE